MSFLNKVCSSLLPMLFHYNEDCNKLACTMGSQEERPPVNAFVNITECCYCSVLFHFFTDCQSLNEFSTSESYQTDIQESCRILYIEKEKKKKRSGILSTLLSSDLLIGLLSEKSILNSIHSTI